MIQMIDNDTFTLKRGAHSMTLSRSGEGWKLLTENAATRAWNGWPSCKQFDSLNEVERNYKSWRGVSQLVVDHATTE